MVGAGHAHPAGPLPADRSVRVLGTSSPAGHVAFVVASDGTCQRVGAGTEIGGAGRTRVAITSFFKLFRQSAFRTRGTHPGIGAEP
jgi:hypothetical protein